MLNQEKIREQFDLWADSWDENQAVSESAVEGILDAAGIRRGSRVLDIACGTGVLFPFYRKRGTSAVTGVDCSPKMTAIASGKIKDDPSFTVLTGDAASLDFRNEFDAVMIYDALPHFPDIARLIRRAYDDLAEGGTLTVAHSMSRAEINLHHVRVPEVSNELPTAKELAALFRPYFRLQWVRDDSSQYLVSGIRRPVPLSSEEETFFGRTGEHTAEAYHILLAENHSAVAGHSDGEYFFDDRRGIAPLLSWHETPSVLRDAFIADKVIGKAAALLLADAGIRELYAHVMSAEACRILEEARIPYNFSILVPQIINRRGDDLCPMEKSVRTVEKPADAYEVLKKAVEEMKKENPDKV